VKHTVWLRVLLCALVCVLLVGCSADKPSGSKGDTSTSSTTTTTVTTTTTTTTAITTTTLPTTTTTTTATTTTTTVTTTTATATTTTSTVFDVEGSQVSPTTTKATTTTWSAPIFTTTTAPTIHIPNLENKQELNVLDYGVDNTGKVDATTILTQLHATGKRIYYPNGTYLFNGKTLDFSGGVRFESQSGVLIRNSLFDTPIVNLDNKGNLIGLMHNHLEYTVDKAGVDTIGNLVFPPLSTANYQTRVDLLPYWYNDFGRNTHLIGKLGWRGWYSWEWNHHSPTRGGEYDPNMHPLLGWYRSDEPEVLDWICYWLREYGVNQTALTAYSLDNDPAMNGYWAYQLLNHAPNAKQMDFALWLSNHGYNETYEIYRTNWWKTFEQFYFNDQYKDQVYCYEENGKRYPVVWIWEEKGIRYSLDPTEPNKMPHMTALYKEVAAAFRENGYDGVCFIARKPAVKEHLLPELAAAGVKWFSATYANNAPELGATYAERVENYAPLTTRYALYGVSSGLHTHEPHPSKWNCPGNTPQLFGKWLQKAIEFTVSDPSRPQIITCYNVSEWAEGSTGLVPTVGSGYGYLEAIRDAIVIS